MSFKRITRIISVLAALMILIFNEGCNHAPSDVADVRPAAEITSGPMIDSVYETHPLISVSISTVHNELKDDQILQFGVIDSCLLYTSPSPRDQRGSRMAACG